MVTVINNDQYDQINLSNLKEFFNEFNKVIRVGNTFVKPKKHQPRYVSSEQVNQLNQYKKFNIKI